MVDVLYQLVVWCLVQVVQGYGEFDNVQVGGEVIVIFVY